MEALGPSERERFLREHEDLARVRRKMRECQVEAAVLLAGMERSGSFVFHGTASLGEYGEKSGWCGANARRP